VWHPHFRLEKFIIIGTFLQDINFKHDSWEALDLALPESLTTSGLVLIEFSLRGMASKLIVELKARDSGGVSTCWFEGRSAIVDGFITHVESSYGLESLDDH
jgi:hypothetical protein